MGTTKISRGSVKASWVRRWMPWGTTSGARKYSENAVRFSRAAWLSITGSAFSRRISTLCSPWYSQNEEPTSGLKSSIVNFSSMRGLCSTLAMLAGMLAAAAPAAARNVYFVDNARTAPGSGAPDAPFIKLSQAAAASHDGDIIYVAEGVAPYDDSITLKRGQLLIGAAYGLDAVAVDLKEAISAPPTPAVQGPGPTIHGGVWLMGDNVVAGCTIVAESGSAVGSSAPSGPISIRNTF